MEEIFMIIGFLFAAYAVVGNDAIQTLGTFLSSNSNRPWWVLWLYSSSILVAVILYGLYIENDISYQKFGKLFEEGEVNSYPNVFSWWFIIPPLVLLVITQFGIPVSTTFLILSVFSEKAIPAMIIKSATGYAIAFGVAVVVYMIISRTIESHFIRTYTGKLPSAGWVAIQWVSTGFLWAMWLMQDMVNIFVYFYRPIQSPSHGVSYILFGAFALVIMQAILFYFRGGAIQKIVTSKTNTTDVRSATIIDFIYGLILLFLKGPIPLSTTWVFVGLLAGREFAVNYQLKMKSVSAVGRVALSDLAKVIAGLLVSVAIVILLNYLKG